MSQLSQQEKTAVFDIKNLRTWYPLRKGMFKRHVGDVKAVDDLSLTVYKGETLGVVGESGCGKSTLGKSIMRLENPTGGEVLYNFDGEFKDIMRFDRQELFQFRKRVQMVFQDPYSALNPVKRVYDSFSEPLKVHGYRSAEERQAMIESALKLVNIQPDYLMRFPHEFSGGQRQRLCIARALCIRPNLLVCDEPVSALDVSIQAQVLNLMKDIQKELDLTYIFIAHDLSVVEYMSDRVAVMYLGKIVELADAGDLSRNALHPYTQALFSAVPLPDIHQTTRRTVLRGEVPSAISKPTGCAFHLRCAHCMDICKTVEPELKAHDGTHQVACHLYNQ